MKLVLLLSVLAVVLATTLEVSLEPTAQLHHFNPMYMKHIQCRQCTGYNSMHQNPNDPKVSWKWCATSRTTDYDGTCVKESMTCPEGATAIVLQIECPNDAPATKKSCSLCMLDGYQWCTPDVDRELVFPHPPGTSLASPGDYVGDEYDGECVPRPAPAGPAHPPHEGAHPTDPAQPVPHDVTPPTPSDPQPTPPLPPAPPAPVCKPGMMPVTRYWNCPVVVAQNRPVPAPCPACPVSEENSWNWRKNHSHKGSAAAFIVPCVLIASCLLACVCKRRRDRRRREMEAHLQMVQQSHNGVAPVTMPVAQPVMGGYEMAQHVVQPVYPQVIHTGQPLRYQGGPLISAPTSFLPPAENPQGGVEMQGRSNGYSQVSQMEP